MHVVLTIYREGAWETYVDGKLVKRADPMSVLEESLRMQQWAISELRKDA